MNTRIRAAVNQHILVFTTNEADSLQNQTIILNTSKHDNLGLKAVKLYELISLMMWTPTATEKVPVKNTDKYILKKDFIHVFFFCGSDRACVWTLHVLIKSEAMRGIKKRRRFLIPFWCFSLMFGLSCVRPLGFIKPTVLQDEK